MSEFGPPEHVYVEFGYYDGPRSGIAEISGKPHRFESQFDEDKDGNLETFLVWPIGSEELALEVEQWLIFAAWNQRYEAGEVEGSTHPGYKGMNEQWDRLEHMLAPLRARAPINARRARAKFVPLNRGMRYSAEGPDYAISWSILENGAET